MQAADVQALMEVCLRRQIRFEWLPNKGRFGTESYTLPIFNWRDPCRRRSDDGGVSFDTDEAEIVDEEYDFEPVEMTPPP